MLYQVAIAICLAGAPQCDRLHNIAWSWAPEPKIGLSACFLHGQVFAAESGMVTAGRYAKVYCKPYPAAGGRAA